mmetsp:Transcript_41005/g.89355  ORF Transcript_41005/g.89355 Transcript_41005/m.89355 type:complete len:581 (+) Transcript_41005:2-1744(+)
MFAVVPAARESSVPGFSDLVQGSRWYAFYRMNQISRWRQVLNDGCLQAPLAGLSDGWVQVEVLNTFNAAEYDESRHQTWVKVKFLGTFVDPLSLDQRWSPELSVKPCDLRISVPRPALSLLNVRWFNYYEQRNAQWNCLGEALNSGVIDGVGGAWEAIPSDYEVVTIFVRGADDIQRINPVWAAQQLRGRHRCCTVHLWPTQSNTGDGYVPEDVVFRCLERLEQAGIPLRHPSHSSMLYRQLCGKTWIPAMSRNPLAGVPPSVRLMSGDCRSGYGAAVARAYRVLSDSIVDAGMGNAGDPVEGVMKAGFSWMGQDVTCFAGQQQLDEKARKMLKLDSLDATVQCIYLQHKVNKLVELRRICFYDRVSDQYQIHTRYMVVEQRRNWDFEMTSAKTYTEAEALEHVFKGNTGAKADAERQAAELGQHWLQWMQRETGSKAAFARLDFLVEVDFPTDEDKKAKDEEAKDEEAKGEEAKDKEATVKVWTCEVTEIGGSLCGLSDNARNAAVLSSCFTDVTCGTVGCLCTTPRPLPVAAVEEYWTHAPRDAGANAELSQAAAEGTTEGVEGSGAAVASGAENGSL